MARQTRLQEQGSDDGPRIPFGEWGDQAIDWADSNLKWLFDATAWPVDRGSELLLGAPEGGEGLLDAPRLLIILGFAALAYIGGGIKRGAFVGGALGVCALMGNRMWDQTAVTLGSLVLLFVGVFVITGVVLAALGGRIIRQPAAQRTAAGWSLIQPYGLLLPGVFFWGIGTTSMILTTLCLVAPLAVGAAAASEINPTNQSASHRRPGLVAARTLHGIHTIIPILLVIVGFFAIAGIGGLSQWLFRGVSNQDPVMVIDASIAFWLLGFVAWKLTTPWSLDHLPEFLRRRGAETDLDNEADTVHEPVDITIGE